MYDWQYLLPSDILLLCSDGLSDLVEDHEIAKILQRNPLQEASKGLTSLALKYGGYDNITTVALQMPELEQPRAKRQRLPWLIATSLGIIVLLLAEITLYLFLV